MMKIYTCPHCNTAIRLKLFFGNAHLKCPNCGCEYQMTMQSTKLRMLEPFVAVGIAVSTSLLFLKGKTIDIKTLYILGVSFLLASFMDMLLVHIGLLTYEKKVDG